MFLTRLKRHLEFATNVAVVLIILAAVAVAARQYFHSKDPRTGTAKIQTGTTFPNFDGVDYARSRKTLILALNVSCRFCIASIPFYQQLAQVQRENDGLFQAVAIFLNQERDQVSQFVEERKLSITAVPAVDFSKLNITSTPTILLVDESGTVLNSWVGRLSEDGEKDVFNAIGIGYKPRLQSSTTVRVYNYGD